MESLSIFDMMYEEYKITKKIRLIELFAGYGSQALALKYLGANFEHHKICEWAVNSIIAYADVHKNELKNYGIDYSKELTKTEIAEKLFNYGVSLDYNKPATLDQIKRMNEDKMRLTYNSIMWSNNLVDVSKATGVDLEINDCESFTYLLTYSFPCQDLSLAGKGAGMEKGSGTRSGLLWEVERLLSECDNKPQVLLMENVTQVHGLGNDEHFKEWQLRLEEFGYQSYWEDLSATEYGIPQTRNRTFMVSVLGDYNYRFPKRIKLNLRLKDLLESNVDEKYYLSERMINYITKNNDKWTGNNDKSLINKEVASTINTGEGSRRCDASNYVSDNLPDEYDIKVIDSYNKKLTDPNFSGTLSTRQGSNQGSMIIEPLKIKNATKKGYLEAEEGDGIDISSRMDTHRGTVQKGKAQTVTTMGGENVGVVVNMKTELCNDLIKNGKVKENDVIRHSYTTSRKEQWEERNVEFNNLSPTLDTRADCLGVVVKDNDNYYGTYDYAQSDTLRPSESDRLHLGKDVSGALLSSGNHNGIVVKDEVINPLKNKTDKSWFFEQQIYDDNGSARSLKATDGSGNIPKVIVKDESINYSKKSLEKIKKNIIDEEDTAGSITATGMQSINHDGCQLVSLKRGYDVEVKTEKEESNEIDFIGNYSKSNFNQRSIVGKNGLAPTVTENHGQVTAITEPKVLGGIGEKKSNGGTQYYQQDRIYDDSIGISVTTSFNPYYADKNMLRIRKLTPKECGRLMSVKDEDVALIMKHQTNSSAYHLFGDSIVITCLMAMFGKLLDVNWEEKFKPGEWWKNE